MVILVQLQSSHFPHKIYSQCIKQKNFFVIKYSNVIELLIKFYNINYSNYHHLVPLTKRTVFLQNYTIRIGEWHLNKAKKAEEKPNTLTLNLYQLLFTLTIKFDLVSILIASKNLVYWTFG